MQNGIFEKTSRLFFAAIFKLFILQEDIIYD